MSRGRSGGSRLPPGPTCRVDFSRPLEFTFLDREMTGYAGDTVASALYGAGVRIFGRSLKYHRPRGLYSMEGESANTLMSIDGVPNECAETTALRAGMAVGPQNVRGDPGRDRFGFLNAFDRLMPAGFYYHLFHRPQFLWPLFQSGLRRMAGTGVLDPQGDYGNGVRAERYLNADVVVVGGGPAGMAAALAAGESGLRVCLFERRNQLGGHLAWRVRDFEGEPLYRRAETLAARVRAAEHVKVFTSSLATGIWGENLVTGFTVGTEDDPFRECHWECRARTVVVAAGCMDRPLVFNHNDRPGVMQVGTAWRLARTYGVRPGKSVAFSVADDLGLEAAIDLDDMGVRVRFIADARESGQQDPKIFQALSDRAIPFFPGCAVSRAVGGKRVRGCVLRSLKGRGSRRFRCDLLVANAGMQPRIGTLATANARLAYCPHTHGYQPTDLPPGVFVAGSMTGLRDPRSIEVSGRVAGYGAAGWCGDRGKSGARAAAAGAAGAAAADAAGAALREAKALPGPPAGCGIIHAPAIGRGAKAFVDLDEDGTYKNVKESMARGLDVPELAKRFAGFGLGPGQYRVAGQNLAMIMADLRGDPVETARPTTVRPPLGAPSIATLAGPGHDVHKRTPVHAEQARQGATFRRAGPWQRARHFGDDPSCREEIRNVRTNVGILDSSPLGKFRIHGPDALKALQRVCISDMSKARPGYCKYSAMCNDMGQIMDDGVVVVEGPNDYYFTTSSARAGATVEWFRFHTRHDGWDYNLVNLTDVLGSLNIAGPHARKVLERVTGDSVSNEAFPYLACRRITVGDGIEARCLRLGFVGELSFELHAPASSVPYLWDLLMEAGADFRIRPFGLEAQNCLRAEKGHVIIGTESEQRVTLTDIGMGWMWDRDDTASKKVGAPALRACERQPGRLKLVGLRVEEGGDAPEDGTLVVDGEKIVGYVCTTRSSEALGWQYGLALVHREHAFPGRRIHLCHEETPGERVTSTAFVISPHFYDPRGQRLRS